MLNERSTYRGDVFPCSVPFRLHIYSHRHMVLLILKSEQSSHDLIVRFQFEKIQIIIHAVVLVPVHFMNITLKILNVAKWVLNHMSTTVMLNVR